MKKRVVITGIGPVTSIGIGKDDFWKNLLSGDLPEVKKVPQYKIRTKSKFYIPFPEFSLSTYDIPKYYRFLQPEDKLAIVGAKLALEDAGIKLFLENKKFLTEIKSKISVILGTGFTGLETAFHSYLAHIGVKYYSERQQKKVSYNRMVIPMLMTNSPSAWISILFGLQGENFTVNAACASGTIAIGQAYQKILNGNSDIVVTGGVENLQDEEFSIFRGFDVLGALTKSESGNPQPFSDDRSGFLFSEGGSCLLVLEKLSHAKQRDAKIYAEILDYQSNCDAYNIVQIEPSGKQIMNLLTALIKNERIDYLNSHGTGTIPNDEIESKAIINYFGKVENQPFINSTKSILGHTIGASGAIETAVTALSIFNNEIHSNNVENPIENLNLAQKNIKINIEKAISVSYGFGGHNGGLLFGKFHE
ncbi:MAG: beta-ketoacyl-[acyl-carrier-protein] synthase family protein [Candidatus Cloacimonetes bacterium]|nr:beta-ketoacyl-[acyl-carrier-protein] synthase family protein [Candidatus Cloacimonadota bacterium]